MFKSNAPTKILLFSIAKFRLECRTRRLTYGHRHNFKKEIQISNYKYCPNDFWGNVENSLGLENKMNFREIK
jgi:hypothetical protein